MGIPPNIAFEDARDPSSSLYLTNGLPPGPDKDISSSSKRSIIDTYLLLQRCQEEETFLDSEIHRIVEFYRSQIIVVSTEIDRYGVEKPWLKSCLSPVLWDLTNELERLVTIFQKFGKEIGDEVVPVTALQLDEVSIKEELFQYLEAMNMEATEAEDYFDSDDDVCLIDNYDSFSDDEDDT